MSRNSKSIYGDLIPLGKSKSIYGYKIPIVPDPDANLFDTCPISCEKLVAIDNYVKQITRRFSKLNRDTKLYTADKALDSMTTSIETRISTLKSTNPT